MLVCFKQGARLLFRTELRRYVIIPLVINLILYSIAFGFAYHFLDGFIALSIPRWLDWLRWLLWPLFFVLYGLLIFFSFAMLANLLAAPFYGKLAHRSLEINGAGAVMQELGWIKVVAGELQRWAYLAKWALSLIILSIIPGLNLLAPFLWVVYGAWALALEYMSYPLENAGLDFNEQRKQLRQQRLSVLSFGGIVLFTMGLPLLSVVMPPLAVITASLYWRPVH